MLNPACIRGSDFFRNTQVNEHIPKHRMALIYFFCCFPTKFRQGKKPILVNGNMAALLQKAHSATDAGLGVPHIFSHINGADIGALQGKNVNGFQVHFSGFLQTQREHLFLNLQQEYHISVPISTLKPGVNENFNNW